MRGRDIVCSSESNNDKNAKITVRIGCFDTIVATKAELANLMVKDSLSREAGSLPKLVFSSNGQGVALAGTNRDFLDTMKKADIIHADGMSVVAASTFFGKTRLPERVATTDFFHNAANEAIANNLSFYFLGGSEEQNKKVTDAVRETYPGLCIAGRRNGYFENSQELEVCNQIVESGADVLWVGLGKPMQEFWSVRNQHRLMGVAWIKTCGGLYAFLAGDSRRAPSWMQKVGLEWLWRLKEDPFRLSWRYIKTNPYALYRLVRYSGN